MKARTQTREVTETVKVLVTNPNELNTARNPLERQMESEVVNIRVAPQQAAIRAQQNARAILRIIAGAALAIVMLVPLAIIPVLIVAILPTEIYILGRVYDDVVEIRSTKANINDTGDVERANEENEKARMKTYGAHLVY